MKSQNDDLRDPERVEGTDCWRCPWCKRKDFTELSQVWTHFDTLDNCKQLLIYRCLAYL